MSSEAWKRQSQAVLAFLETPQDWKAMENWIHLTQFGGTRFRHVLAWLEEQRLAITFVRKDKDEATGATSEQLYWVNTLWVSRVSVRPPRM